MWFNFTWKLLIIPVEVYNYFGLGYHNPPKEKSPHLDKKLILNKSEVKHLGYRIQLPPPKVPIEASRGITASK